MRGFFWHCYTGFAVAGVANISCAGHPNDVGRPVQAQVQPSNI
jgi:hypothetical protein